MTVTKNKVVGIDYTLTDDKGTLLDSTAGGEPLEYLHGFGNIIPGLEKALEGRAQGERFSVELPAADAYGEYDKDLIAEIPRAQFNGFDSVEAGMQFQAHTPAGLRLFTVLEVGGQNVKVDGNHPLAGMALSFDVTVAGLRDASGEELSHGHVHGHAHSHGCDGCEGDECGCGGGECGDNCGCEGDGCGGH